MSDQLRSLRLVIASPGDVRQERDTVSRVVDEINQYGISVDYKLTIKVVRWETDAWPGFHPEGPQGLIDPVIDIENSDLVVGIFWKRFGTPTAEARSGTVHELQHAIDAWRRKGSPLVMIYFSQQPYTPQSKEETEQWGQVINFRDHFPEKGLWWGYETPEEFQKLLRMHLTNAIRAKFGNLGVLALETTTSQPGAAVSQVWPASEAPASEFLSRIPPLWNKRTIGRDDAIRDLLRDLSQPGLVTLTGAAGCGKTRVAVEVANRARTLFSDGVLFVELAPLAPAGEKGSLVPSRIATLAGVREQATTPPTKVLAEYIAGKQFLLVLDNCEHLAGSCAEVAEYLLMNCANLRILATSRVLLRIAAEKPYPLGCLSVPGAGKLTTIDAIAQSEAVQMFVERAQLRQRSFKLDASNAEAVAELSRALDGLPLAIELAAARLGVKSVQEMSLHSQDLLKSLGESRAGDFRSWSTLTAALKWSYDLLPAAEASFMRRLAVFAGGWSEAAAAAVTSSPGERDAVAGYLQNLVDHSLVASRETGGAVRFRFLEPIRQFALQQMKPAEKRKAERKHAEYFLKLAEESSPRLLQAEQARMLDVLQAEADNLQAAVRWAVAKGEAEIGLRLIAALWRFVEIRGYLKLGREGAEGVLGIPGASKFPALRSKVLSGAGILAYRQGDFEPAEKMFEESLAIGREQGDDAAIANALSDLGKIAKIRGEYQRALRLYTEGLEIERRLGNQRQIAVALNNLGAVAAATGDYDEATRVLRQSVTLFEGAGNLRESAFPLNHLARVAILRREFHDAWFYAQRSLTHRNQLSDRRGVAETLRSLSWIYIETQDYVTARDALKDSVTSAMEVGDKQGLSESIDLWALLEHRLGNTAMSVFWYAAAEAARLMIGSALPDSEKTIRDGNLASARQALGHADYERYWRDGLATPLQDAVARAIAEGSPGTPNPADRR